MVVEALGAEAVAQDSVRDVLVQAFLKVGRGVSVLGLVPDDPRDRLAEVRGRGGPQRPGRQGADGEPFTAASRSRLSLAPFSASVWRSATARPADRCGLASAILAVSSAAISRPWTRSPPPPGRTRPGAPASPHRGRVGPRTWMGGEHGDASEADAARYWLRLILPPRRFVKGLLSGPRSMSCVDGSRVARLDFMFWRSGRVQSCVRPVDAVVRRLLALMESASSVPLCFAGFDALDIGRGVPAPGLTGSPSLHIALATS